MSIDVALQSVAFYVLSCSTCAKASHRRKAKARAKRERVEKKALEAEHPELYRHPSPFSTNQYWNEDIMMGPGPMKRNERGANKCTCPLDTQGQTCSYAGSTAMNSEAPSSPTAVTEGSSILDDLWNRKRYQREDEALWGYDYQRPGQIIKDAVVKAGCAAGRLLEGGFNIIGGVKEEEENPPKYYVRNPPVNDLHPPIVSTTPSSIAETRWMIQPPPTAKVMEGKQRVNRSRASSNTSSRKGVDNTPLIRRVIERPINAKLNRGESQIQIEGLMSESGSGFRLKKIDSLQSDCLQEDNSPRDSLGSLNIPQVKNQKQVSISIEPRNEIEISGSLSAPSSFNFHKDELKHHELST